MRLNLLLVKLKRKIYPCMNVRNNSSVSLLLEDRPEIAELLKGHDDLKRWLFEQFSGKATKFPILWDPREPKMSDTAECSRPWKNKSAKIRVSRGLSGLDQLAGVAYELFNIRNDERFSRIWKKAFKGKIDKQKYILEADWFEYKAMKKCRRFLKNHQSVFATADDSDRIYNTIMFVPSFRKYLKGNTNETYFARTYDEKIVPRLKENLRRN